MDPSNINQLDVSGSLGLINSNASTMTVTPNTSGAALVGWQNNNITWVATATNPWSATSETGFSAFTNSYLTNGTGSNSPYLSLSNTYNATTGVYTNTTYTTSTTVDGTAIAGEYIQLSSSVPLIMKTYNLTSRYISASTPYNFAYALPRQYKIVGSNDGVTWTSIQDAQFSAAPITTAATSTTYSQTTATYNIVTTTSAITQQSNNSITGYANALNAYSYFRIIVRAIMGTNFSFSNPNTDTRTNFFWNVNFSPVASCVSMALDNATPNQLNIGGSLGIGNGLGVTGPITSTTNSGNLILNPTGGYVGIGTTSPAYPLDVNGIINTTSSLRCPGIYLSTVNPSIIVSAGAINFGGTALNYNPGTANAGFDVNGYFGKVTSSRRFKENIRYLDNPEFLSLDMIHKYRPVLFNIKHSADLSNSSIPQISKKNDYIGYIAEDLDDIGEKLFVVYESDDTTPNSIQYDKIIVHAVECIKVLHNKIVDLETRLADIEQKNV